MFNKQNEKKTFCLYVLMSSLFVFLLLLLVFCCTFSIHFGLIISFLYLSCLLERNSTIQLMHTSITCNSVIFVVHTRSFPFFRSFIDSFSSVLLLWYFGFSCLPFSFDFFFFLSFFFSFEICSISWYVHFGVIVHKFLYSTSLSLSFAVCERAVLKKYTYITYCIQVERKQNNFI